MSSADNPRAAGLMVASMAGFALEDLFLKRAASAMPPGQVIAMMGAGGAVVFWLIAARLRQPILTRRALTGAAALRTLSEALAAMLYITALALIPLSVNSALLQASPLVVTMGAALVLGEKVGWRRWTAIAVGFLGVLIILQPGTEGFRLAGLLTVACVFLMASRDLSTRVMHVSIGTFQLTTWAYLGLVPAGLVLMAMQGQSLQAIDPSQWVDLTGALVTGLFAYYAVTAAMRLGEVSVVAPFRYARLVFAMILAMIFFGERPDVWMLTGAALVIGSGLYTFAREARVKRALSMKADPR
ncbi:DMT family transporter [Pseudotabrizicola sp. 4114]|uniref:DMT family transporter n=1 Tax=Pseudotabrizicola sp. 4114 TaxID=2817731 RepID=UPI0032B7C14E